MTRTAVSRNTHTYAVLEVAPSTYADVRARLIDARPPECIADDEREYLDECEGQELVVLGTIALIADRRRAPRRVTPPTVESTMESAEDECPRASWIVTFWEALTAVLSIASVGFAICGVFAVWFALSLISNAGGILVCDGRGHLFGCTFDSGGNYGNALQNYLQLLLLFANLSMTSAIGANVADTKAKATEAHAKAHAAERTAQAAHARIDQI